jgi:hypothetical protein
MNVRELVAVLEEMNPELEVWIYVDEATYGMGFERMTKHDVEVRNGRVEIA